MGWSSVLKGFWFRITSAFSPYPLSVPRSVYRGGMYLSIYLVCRVGVFQLSTCPKPKHVCVCMLHASSCIHCVRFRLSAGRVPPQVSCILHLLCAETRLGCQHAHLLLQLYKCKHTKTGVFKHDKHLWATVTKLSWQMRQHKFRCICVYKIYVNTMIYIYICMLPPPPPAPKLP